MDASWDVHCNLNVLYLIHVHCLKLMQHLTHSLLKCYNLCSLLVEHSRNRHKAVKGLLMCLKRMTPTAGAMERMKVK